ncbi:hypothetical protein [Rhodovulum sp. P5]|nr:hypothetical protein [Rhodovulum sp. P5]
MTFGPSLLTIILAYWLGGTLGALMLILREVLRPEDTSALADATA